MARGSAPGERRGGRAKGTPNTATGKRREVAEAALASGLTPLDVMLNTMRKLWEKAETGECEVQGEGDRAKIVTPMEMRLLAADVAQKAAPFVHPKLSNIEANVKAEVGVKVIASPEDEAL